MIYLRLLWHVIGFSIGCAAIGSVVDFVQGETIETLPYAVIVPIIVIGLLVGCVATFGNAVAFMAYFAKLLKQSDG